MQICMALFLGVRHGLDLDHIATIDSITRTTTNVRMAKYAGVFFSLGHGLVVILLSLIIGSGIANIYIPQWLNGFGNFISVTFLFIFGILTLWSVFHSSETEIIPLSIRGLVSKVIFRKGQQNVIYIVLIGAFFALSFDTFSQVALFSLSAKTLFGGFFAAALGITFMLGMMMSDGVNGYLVAKILQRADNFSIHISQITGLIIAAFSLIICIMNLSKIINA